MFLRRGTLFAVPFDIDRLEVHGAPVAVSRNGRARAGWRSRRRRNGCRAVRGRTDGHARLDPGPAAPSRQSELVTVDHRGHVPPLRAPARFYGDEVRPSPDGRQLAVTIRTLTRKASGCMTSGPRDAHAAGTRRRRVCTGLVAGRAASALLLVRGRSTLARIAACRRQRPPRVLAPGRDFPTSFAPDGRRLAAVTRSAGEIVIATLDNGQAQVQPLLQVPHGDRWPAFSPDGRWLAYGSNVSGRDEVYVRAYPGPGPAEQVTVESGHSPAWRPDGKELFFVRRSPGPPAEYSMMAVAFRAGPRVPSANRRSCSRSILVTSRSPALPCAATTSPQTASGSTPSNTRILQPPPVVTHVNLIVNWFEELKTKGTCSR